MQILEVILIGIKRPNKYTSYDDYVVLNIKSDKYGEFDFIIDLDDYERVKQYRWSIMAAHSSISDYVQYYASTQGYPDCKHMLLHRYLVNTPKGKLTDHIDGNTLNNRKSNLRICTYKENSKNRAKNINNTSGVKGVTWSKKDNAWMAYIYLNKRFKNLGYFNKLEDAAVVRRRAEERYFGEYNREIQYQ